MKTPKRAAAEKFLARGSVISFLFIRTTEEGQIEHLTPSFHWAPVMMTRDGQKVPVTNAQELRGGNFISEEQFQKLFLPASVIADPEQEKELRKACVGSEVTIFETVSMAGQPLHFFWATLPMRRSVTTFPSG